jgi:prepilin-type N-terminal cleavage/methylation domain-containing protein
MIRRDTRPAGTDRRGFTLIETLLAIGIGVVVLLLVYSIYHTTLAVRENQGRRRTGPAAAADALDRISRDLASAVMPANERGCPFSLEAAGASGASELTFTTLTAHTGESPAWHSPICVTYMLEGAGERQRLVRLEQAVDGPEAGVNTTNVLVRSVDFFEVRVFNGMTWEDEWLEAGSDMLPAAAGVRIGLPGEEPARQHETEIFIPAGNIITSAVERAGLPQ